MAFTKSDIYSSICAVCDEADLVDSMVALPGLLFYSTQIHVRLRSGGKINTLDSANDARLFDGEKQLYLVA